MRNSKTLFSGAGVTDGREKNLSRYDDYFGRGEGVVVTDEVAVADPNGSFSSTRTP